jgi:hypothetical protein
MNTTMIGVKLSEETLKQISAQYAILTVIVSAVLYMGYSNLAICIMIGWLTINISMAIVLPPKWSPTPFKNKREH